MNTITPTQTKPAVQGQPRKNIEDIYPLSPMQEGILFHCLLSPKAGMYVPQVSLSLTGDLQVEILRQAWQAAIDRHSCLRTGFYWEQRDQPFQVVYRQVELPWQFYDWRSLDTADHDRKRQQLLETNRTQNFQLNQPPLLRLSLVQWGDRQYELIWSYHHLILDGWSASHLLKEVFSHYFSQQHTPTKVFPFSDPQPYSRYIAWLSQQDQAAAQRFWQDYHLKGFEQPVELPLLGTRNALHPESVRSERQQALTVHETTALRQFAQQHQLTLNTLVQGAFALLLQRYSDRDDLVFGVTHAGRPAELAGVETMVGLFMNTLPMRVQIEVDQQVVTWLKNLQTERTQVTAYEYSSLLSIQSWSDVPAGQPLFECLLVFENYPVDLSDLRTALDRQQSSQDLALTQVELAEWTSLPLTVLVSVGEQLSITAKFNGESNQADLHAAQASVDTVLSNLLTHLRSLLLGLLHCANRPLVEVPMLSEAELQQLTDWNQTTTDYDLDLLLPDRLTQQVQKTPEAIAVLSTDLEGTTQDLTYETLHERADQLAQTLQTCGVGPEVLVAVCLERSPNLIIALLAILKAGGTYVPLDPSYPRERLQWMLEDSGSVVLLSDRAGHEALG
ncbi:MAG: condensation domain-containing protein, partial [Cyanobacteria bacterium P01_H01_bin.121]